MPKFGFPDFCFRVLPLLDARHCCKLSLYVILRETNETNLKNGIKPNISLNFGSFGPNLGPHKFFLWVLPPLDVKHYCKLSLYAISMKNNDSNSRKWEKHHFGPDLGLLGPKSGHNFFKKIWFHQSLDIMVNYHHVETNQKI